MIGRRLENGPEQVRQKIIRPANMGKSISKRLDRYLSHIDRLRGVARNRAQLTGADFVDSMIAEQVALRSLELSKSSFYVEKAAARAFFEDTPDLDPEDRQNALDLLSLSREEVISFGQEKLAHLVDIMVGRGDTRSSEEIAYELSGITTNVMLRGNGGTSRRRRRVPVTAHDTDRLTEALIDQDPLGTLVDRLRKTRGTKSRSFRALSGIMLQTCWLSGMRPVELFQCVIAVIVNDRVCIAPDDLDSRIPEIANQNGAGIGGLRAIGATILELARQNSGEVILAIRNAKTANANASVQEYRIQNLKGIDAYRLGVIWVATQLRRLDFSPDEIRGCRDLVTKHARAVSLRLRPDPPPVTLYSMRHDFSDRAKRAYSKPEVAALMGHTGRNSGSHYGTKNVRRGSGFTPGRHAVHGWLPTPDAEQAARLIAHWSPSFGEEPAPHPAPEALPAVEQIIPAPVPDTALRADPVDEPQDTPSFDQESLTP